jgi:hypothetical protein
VAAFEHRMDRDQLTGLDDLDRFGERMHLEDAFFGWCRAVTSTNPQR